jgi:O-antigen/teichoic acid export membrane protein
MRKDEFHNHDREIFTIAKGAGIFFIGTLINSGFTYLFTIIVARNLGPQLFGFFFSGFALFRLAGTLAEMGLPSGIVRYVALFQAQGDQSRTTGIIVSSLAFALISSLLVALLLVLLSRTLALNFFHQIDLANVLRSFAMVIPFTTLTTMMVSSTQGLKTMKYTVIVRDIIEPSSRFVLVSILFLLGYKLNAVLFTYLSVTAFGTILGYHCLTRVFPHITRRAFLPFHETIELINFSWPLFLAQFFALMNLWIDTIMLGYYRTSQEVGIYSAAQRTAFLGALVIISFNTIFAPVISDLCARGRCFELSGYFKTVAKWTFTFNFPILLLLIYFAKSLMNMFGTDFVAGAPTLVILSIGWLVLSGTGSSNQTITMSGRSKFYLVNTFCVLITHILMNLLFIPAYGISGAALATAISISLGSLVALLEARTILRIHPYRLDFIKPLAAGCMSLGVLFIIERYVLQNHNVFACIALVSIFMMIYSCMLFLFGISKEDRLVLERLQRGLFRYRSISRLEIERRIE